MSAPLKGDYDRAWRIVKTWARRNAARGPARSVAPLLEPDNSGSPLIDRWLSLVCPWYVSQYPSRALIIQAICGLKGRGLLTRWRREGISPAAADKLAAFLESRIVREQILSVELREWAIRRRATMLPGYLARPLTWETRKWLDDRARAARQARRVRIAAEREREAAMIAEVVGIREAGE